MKGQRHFRDDLDKLKSKVVGMAGLAEQSVRDAVRALLERDEAGAQLVRERDNEIDRLELEIDDLAINLLALQQPMAKDLRFITMAMRISNDLERVGDHAVNIAEAVGWLLEAPPFPVIPEIEEMVRVTTEMLSSALDAFVRADSKLAREIPARDDRVDELHENNFRILLTHMLEEPRKITAGMDLLLISGNIERIADLATNIAEEVVYLVEGQSIKHYAKQRTPPEPPTGAVSA